MNVKKLHFSLNSLTKIRTAVVAQQVRAPDCGSGCRGFKSRRSPHLSDMTFDCPCVKYLVRSGDILYICSRES